MLVLLAVAHQLAPPPAATVPVTVAARSLARSAVIVQEDLTVVRMAVDLAPEGAVADPAELVGRSVASSLPRGLPVVGPLLHGTRFGVEPPAGTVVVAVTLAQGTATALLRPGDVIDLVVPSGAGMARADDGGPGALSDGAATPEAVPAATGALVVQVGSPEQPSAGGLLDAGGGAGEIVTLVAVTPAEGRALAAATAWGPLGAVLVS